MSTRRERANEPTRRLNKQLVAAQDAAKFREARNRKNLHTAEIYIDIAKLVLGGVVIGNLFAEKKYLYFIIAACFIISLVLLKIGDYYFNKGNNDI